MINKNYEYTKQAIKRHAKDMKESKELVGYSHHESDQTEIRWQGAMDLTLYPTPMQQLIEKIVTGGTAYTDNSHRAPAESARLSRHLDFRRSLQVNPAWTDEEFERRHPFESRTINEYGLQRHLLEMERRVEDQYLESSELFIKDLNFTAYNPTLDYRTRFERSYTAEVAGFDLSGRLRHANKEQVIKYFQALQDCKSGSEVLRLTDW